MRISQHHQGLHLHGNNVYASTVKLRNVLELQLLQIRISPAQLEKPQRRNVKQPIAIISGYTDAAVTLKCS